MRIFYLYHSHPVGARKRAKWIGHDPVSRRFISSGSKNKTIKDLSQIVGSAPDKIVTYKGQMRLSEISMSISAAEQEAKHESDN